MPNNAAEFLDYVSHNTDRLKHNLRKNITYNPELFDDIFSDTIVKCYENIVANDIIVKDFQNYFFIASKFNYIQSQNKQRRLDSRRMDLSDINEKDLTEKDDDTGLRYAGIMSLLDNNFTPKKKELFIEYYSQSPRPDICDISRKYGYNPAQTAAILRDMMSFLRYKHSDKYIKCDPLF